MKRPFLIVNFAVLASVLFFASTLQSQTGTSAISGIVSDQQGKGLPGAKVTITNIATNPTRSVESTNTGAYTFDLIAPGDYRLEVEARGFSKTIIDNVRALIGKQTETNVQLSVGTISQVVEVRASLQDAVINTQDASLGNVFDSTQIAQLPLEGRNLSDLLSLQPGTTQEGYVTGSRADQSNVTLDGVDINNAQTGNASIAASDNSQVIGQFGGSITSGPVLRLNSEAIEEFRVTTANGNANQGRSAGAQVNLVTKSGSNSWHGAAFEFYRGTLFEANDWFNNAAGVPRTPLVRNTFGGALGGPVVKDKLFFFYSYEGKRDATAASATRLVPLSNLGQGTINYSYCANPSCSSTPVASLNLSQNQQVFQAAGINQAALDALAAAAAKYPANDTSIGDGLNTGGSPVQTLCHHPPK